MTIIEPNKAKYSYNSSILLASLAFIGLALMNIYIYNENVSLKHSISDGSKNFQVLQVANAELKNKFYKITDLGSLNVLAKSNGLVKENKPKYFENESVTLAVNQ